MAKVFAGTKQSGGRGRSLILLSCMALLFLAASASLRAETLLKRMTLSELTREADTIIVGQVKDKQSKFADGMVQTTYMLSVSQSLKGTADSLLQMTVVGGEVPGMPFYQSITGTPSMYKGERVLLFLSHPGRSKAMQDLYARKNNHIQQYLDQLKASGKPVPPVRLLAANHPLRVSPQFVGGWQGCYAIVTDSVGKDMAVPMNAGSAHLVDNPDALRAMTAIKAVKNGTSASQPAGQDSTAVNGGTLSPRGEDAILNSILDVNHLRSDAMLLDSLKSEVRLHLAEQEREAQAGR